MNLDLPASFYSLDTSENQANTSAPSTGEDACMDNDEIDGLVAETILAEQFGLL